MSARRKWAWTGALLVGCVPALAQSLLVHVQGEVGSREAYYADIAVVGDRTPPDKILGSTSVRELDTVVVYEQADKPEFAVLRLQFECVNKFSWDPKKPPPAQPAFDAPVRVRLGEQSWKLRREDLQREPLSAGEWRSSASPLLHKLHKVACHEDVLRSAVVKAADKGKDAALFFGREAAKLGLPADLQLVPHQTAPAYLDFTWQVLWVDAPRPDPSGKWASRPTQQQREAQRARMDEIQQQYAKLSSELKPRLEANLQRMDQEFSLQRRAAELRQGRRLSRNETAMLSVWEGKSETEVAATMGAARTSQSGELRFMTYGREFDNRVIVGSRKGAVWEEGLYENCNVQFVLLPDEQRIYRVADVRIWTQSNQIGQVRFACHGLLETPR